MDRLTEAEEKLCLLLQPFRFLVADPSPSRKSLRMLMSVLMIKPANIELVDTLEEADRDIRARRPEFVFAEHSVLAKSGATAFALVSLHREQVHTGRPRAFVLVTSKGSESATASAADGNIDAVLLKPFTFESLKVEVLRILEAKISPPPFLRELDLGKRHMERGEADPALAAFRRARDMAGEPRDKATVWYYEGSAFQKLGRREEAMRSFAEAMVYEPSHYRSMLGLLEIHTEEGDSAKAYEVAQQIARNHAVPTKLLPEFIRLSVLNKKLEDLLGFFKYAEQVQADHVTMQHLAAGLAVCGLQYLKTGQTAGAIDAFRKAEVASKGSPRILQRILYALISAGLEVEAKAFFARAPQSVRDSPEMKVAELERVERTSSAHHALDFAVRLLGEGTKTQRVFEIAIRRSVEIGRKQRHIDELVAEAVRACPDKRNWFEALAAEPSPQPHREG